MVSSSWSSGNVLGFLFSSLSNSTAALLDKSLLGEAGQYSIPDGVAFQVGRHGLPSVLSGIIDPYELYKHMHLSELVRVREVVWGVRPVCS